MLRIPSPKIGILNLLAENDDTFASADRSWLEPLFENITEERARAPKCDVLFIYCRLGENGSVHGAELTLPAIISASGALVAIVATGNTASAYTAAFKDAYIGGAPAADVVLTLDRRGDLFGDFFTRLFDLMFRGKSFVRAWMALAPQARSADQSRNPEALFLAAGGETGFAVTAPNAASSNGGFIRSLLSRLKHT